MTENKKTIYIHIGAPKTGTTSIQTFLTKNYDVLMKKGIFYPLVGRRYDESMVNGCVIVKDLCLANKCKYVKNTKIIEEFNKSSCKTMLLSEESILYHFSFCGSAAIDEVFQYFNKTKFNIKIIAYIRNNCEFLTSYWAQLIKDGPDGKFIRNLNSIINDNSLSLHIKSMYELIYKFSDYFGKENIIIKPFEKKQFKNGNLIDDFLSILNVENSSDFQQTRFSNVSLDRNVMEKFLLLRSFDLKIEEKYRENLAQSSTKQKIVNTLTDKEMETIDNELYPDQCKIARDFLGKDELFVDRYPKTYKTRREPYKGLTQLDMMELQVITNCLIVNKSEETNCLLENILDKVNCLSENALNKNQINQNKNKFSFILKKRLINLLCAFIPSKQYRKKIRKQIRGKCL